MKAHTHVCGHTYVKLACVSWFPVQMRMRMRMWASAQGPARDSGLRDAAPQAPRSRPQRSGAPCRRLSRSALGRACSPLPGPRVPRLACTDLSQSSASESQELGRCVQICSACGRRWPARGLQASCDALRSPDKKGFLGPAPGRTCGKNANDRSVRSRT